MSDKKADFSGEFYSGTKNVGDAVKKRDFVEINILITRSSGKTKNISTWSGDVSDTKVNIFTWSGHRESGREPEPLADCLLRLLRRAVACLREKRGGIERRSFFKMESLHVI